jgi:aminoglycoside phosphotransferase (APT) family kinase protein
VSEPSEIRDIAAALAAMGLFDPGARLEIGRLSGGVSCDVWRVELAGGSICVKRALARLRVAADWRAPAERSQTEVAWLRFAGAVDARYAPAVLGEDRERHIFAMEYFAPERYPVWKAELAAGTVNVAFAGEVGAALARLHMASAGRADIAAAFANDAQFRALRLEPYLLYTCDRNPDVAQRIHGLARGVAAARIALMQGDISPKNILCGPGGPVFLDAETACYGDPAFDLAFCLNHLLLKCVWQPAHTHAYLESFDALWRAYRAGVVWEEPAALDARAAALLPALLLARIDGKSPVEYLTRDQDRNFVRETAKAILLRDNRSPGDVRALWRQALHFAATSSR